MLRTKLLAAFAAMALLTALCAGAGLLLINRINDTVTVYADVTSPLQSEASSVIDDARRMRAASFKAIEMSSEPNWVSSQIDDLESTTRTRLKKLQELSRAATIDIDIAGLQSLEGNFADTLRQMVRDNWRGHVANATSAERAKTLEAAQREVLSGLRAISVRAEGEVNQVEEKAKIDNEIGRATAESLTAALSNLLTEIQPRLQFARKLMHEVEQIGDAAALVLQGDRTTVDSTERVSRRIFQTIGSVMARLRGRLRDQQGAAEFLRIKGALEKLEASLIGSEGLIASRRSAIDAHTAFENGRANLDATERHYFEILTTVQHSVAGLNYKAHDSAIASIGSAYQFMSFGTALAVVGAFGLAILFSRRITGPLTDLANHAEKIRASGELRPVSETQFSGRFVEMDKLGRGFNAMVSELADAKARLIARSEDEVRKQYERLDTAINSMPLGLCMFDSEQRLIICNKRYAEIYGLPEELTRPGTPLEAILRARLDKNVYLLAQDEFIDDRMAVVGAGKPWYGTSDLSNGRVIAVSHQPLVNGGSIAIHEDVTDKRESELRIAHMAHHDSLTDLPNRTRFREDIVESLARVTRGETLAVLCLDLDHFKDVNDSLGHPIGDALLRQVAERLRGCIRPTDAVARLGGDEFAIVQAGMDQPVSATAMATRLIDQISTPFEIEGHQIVVGASVGIAVAPNDGDDSDELLKKADMALYRAKEEGRGRYRFFEPEMDARMQRRRALELDLRKALVLGQFEVYYQPLVNIETGKVACFEALLRWHHPERGMVPPNDFIPLAEEIGLINQIGSWVLREACKEAASWPDQIRVAVNLSPVQFKSKTLLLEVIGALADSGLGRGRLEVEITETVLLQDTEATIETLNQLRDLGVRISMDDFGTGYSSLGYLRKFPFDKIKIDRSFVGDLSDKPDSFAIVRAVAALGISLGISTTAEGVETAEQLKQLKLEGCTEAQGYLISKAIPASELAALIERIEEPGILKKSA